MSAATHRPIESVQFAALIAPYLLPRLRLVCALCGKQAPLKDPRRALFFYRIIRDKAFHAYGNGASKPSSNISSTTSGSGQTQAPRERVHTASVVKPRS